MNMKFSILSILCLFMILSSCSDNNSYWKEGVIREAGNYSYKDSLYIKVDVENKLVKFTLMDSAKNEIARNVHDFSDLHKWALYLDKDKSLWVLSSDIGYSMLKRNPQTNQYTYTEFDHYLTKDEVPKYLYEDLKEFFD